MTDEEVERVAQAIYASWRKYTLKRRVAWQLEPAKTREYFREHARAAIAAMRKTEKGAPQS